MRRSDKELQAIELMKRICPDFSEYNFLLTDRYKGSLPEGNNLYYKRGSNGELGMVTGKKNQEKFALDRFEKNFRTTTGLDSSRIEEGWTGQTLIELLEHLEKCVQKERSPKMDEILKKITEERTRQDKKWGEQNHSPLLWLSIIGEEYGEMCKEANEYGFSGDLQRLKDLKTEAIQCAACCVAMIESMDRNIFNDIEGE